MPQSRCFEKICPQLSHKKQPTAAHCGQSRALLRSPLPASLHYAATSGHHVSLPCHGGASCEDGCIRRLETGSFECNCFGQENLPKSLFQKSNYSCLNAEGIPAFWKIMGYLWFTTKFFKFSRESQIKSAFRKKIKPRILMCFKKYTVLSTVWITFNKSYQLFTKSGTSAFNYT